MTRTRAFVQLFVLALSLLFATCAAHAQIASFTQDQIIKVMWHGPWPPARRPPARPAAAALGERLFFDPRLSGTGSLLCASCHVPYRAFQDGRAVGFGLEPLERNTPSLFNVAFFRRYGWDGARASLAAQSVRPLLEPKEMRASAAHVAALLRGPYAKPYRQAFSRAPSAADDELLEDAGRALAAFQQTLVSGRTPFDDFRDALAGGRGAASYPLEAQRGLRHFIDRCSSCHAGALFTSGAIVRGIRVPSLRNVAATAPYMHDGSVASLEQAVRHGDPAMSESEALELAQFLKTLSATAPPQ
jgi:cytochrome c peroxidase